MRLRMRLYLKNNRLRQRLRLIFFQYEAHAQAVLRAWLLSAELTIARPFGASKIFNLSCFLSLRFGSFQTVVTPDWGEAPVGITVRKSASASQNQRLCGLPFVQKLPRKLSMCRRHTVQQRCAFWLTRVTRRRILPCLVTSCSQPTASCRKQIIARVYCFALTSRSICSRLRLQPRCHA